MEIPTMIENDTSNTQPVDFLSISLVYIIDKDRMHAMVFSSDTVLFKALLVGNKKDFLYHTEFRFVDTKIHVPVYYTDGRAFFNQRYTYHFQDGTVDKIRMNNRYTQVVGWHNGPTIER